MRALSNETLNFVADVDTQSFITAIRVVLNRYYFGRLINLKFHYDNLRDMIIMTAKIKYPLISTKTHPPIMFTVQQTILPDEIATLDSDGAQSYIEHIVTHVIYDLALAQEAKAS